ncbi:metallophosphoesterase [bacterium]|nr:metallophosphoesterase [bacterium]
MRILFTSDLHDHDHRYRELQDLCQKHAPDLILLGGDCFPRQGQTDASIAGQKRFIETRFSRFLIETAPVTTGFIPGNNDWAACLPVLRQLQKGSALHILTEGPLKIRNWTVLGYSYVPPTPFSFKDFEKRDRPEDPWPLNGTAVVSDRGSIAAVPAETLFRARNTIEEDLAMLHSGDSSREILVSHTPPWGTMLDRLSSGGHAGSRALREHIGHRRYAFSMHGHIHESPRISGQFWDRLGKTACFNPGQAEDCLCAILVDTESGMANHTVYGSAEYA